MFGAICGDIIGSPYEFGQMKNYNFRLFVPDAHPTDDGILTCAVAQAILDLDNIYDFDELEEHCATRLIEFGRNHLNVGYGGNFRKWLLGEITGRQKSWGNGSGMRVSAVAWAYDNLDYVEVAARASAIPTHGSPEGIRGAKAIAAATYLARSGYDKEEIENELLELKKFDNVVVKFGRFIPNQEPHYDAVLGVKLASDNQYAERIS